MTVVAAEDESVHLIGLGAVGDGGAVDGGDGGKAVEDADMVEVESRKLFCSV